MAESVIRILDHGRAQLRAEFTAPAGADGQLAHAELAVDALLTLGQGVLEPLAVDVAAACCDPESGYPLLDPQPRSPFHHLRATPPGVSVAGYWRDAVVTDCARLDRATLLDWFGALLTGQGCTPAGWSDLVVQAGRIRLPAAAESTAVGDHVPVKSDEGLIRYPVERRSDGLWAAGPLAAHPGSAPFEARITNEGGFLTFDLFLNWSPWALGDGAGRSDVDAARRRLTALGWTLT